MASFGGQSGDKNYGHDHSHELYLYPRPAAEDMGFALNPDASKPANEYEFLEDNILSEMAFPITGTAMATQDMVLQPPQWLQEQNSQAAMSMSDFATSNSGFEAVNLAPGDGLSLETLLDGYHPPDSSGEWRKATLQDFQTPNSSFGSQQEQSHSVALSAGLRADSWPKALEDYLMASKKRNCTFPEISANMLQEFGIERSANVLSKKYRMILERDAEDNGIMQFLIGATPSLLRVLQDEMNKLDPEIMNEELRREVWAELQRRLPKLVRSLALQTRMGA
ncbi:hypothetical protein V8E51_011714 [Hyaloscypha variabilis]